ncbi:MAG: NAD(P)-dependent oxidoreductase [Anaerovoracaceae bacterium]
MVAGLIGCGRMGMCMLQKMIEKGFTVVAYDKSGEACERAKAAGAHVAENPAEVGASAKAVIISLPGPPQIEEALFGSEGLCRSLSAEHIIVDTSTVEPETTIKNAKKIKAAGAAYLDCPVLGRPSAAGNWTLPAGGSLEDIEKVRDILEAFAKKIVHVGENGSGNALKLLNQMMFSVINGITSEVMAIASEVGIDPQVFYETVVDSGAATVSGLFRETGRTILEEDFENPAFTVDLLIKDTGLAIGMAERADAPSLLTREVQYCNLIARSQGLGGQDTSALYKVFKGHYGKEKKDEA